MSPAHHGRYVAYYRVSTDRQGRTALGIDDQKKKVLDYLDGGT
jgi:DNA invertase Pin-like site-specific DNA recombinase